MTTATHMLQDPRAQAVAAAGGFGTTINFIFSVVDVNYSEMAA
jgi:hypothetical protein